MRFVWDERRAAANLKKHGVSFDEASSASEDRLGAYHPDALHENRFILIGYSRRHRLLYVVPRGRSGRHPDHQRTKGHQT